MKRNRAALCFGIACSMLLSTPIHAEEKSVKAQFVVESSYVVYLPSTVTIVAPTEYRVDGEVIGEAEGGEATIEASVNTEPNCQVVVKVNEGSFNKEGTGIPLINEKDKSISLTTQLKVKDIKSDTDEYQQVTRNNNVIATFSGKSGKENETSTKGRLYFTAPVEKSGQQGGDYYATVNFVVSYKES